MFSYEILVVFASEHMFRADDTPQVWKSTTSTGVKLKGKDLLVLNILFLEIKHCVSIVYIYFKSIEVWQVLNVSQRGVSWA